MIGSTIPIIHRPQRLRAPLLPASKDARTSVPETRAEGAINASSPPAAEPCLPLQTDALYRLNPNRRTYQRFHPPSSLDMTSAMVPYRGPTTSTTLTTTSYPSSSSALLPARLFTAQTGHAIATELLYRLLVDILNRLLVSLQRVAGRQLDALSSFLERKTAEWRAAREAAREAAKKSAELSVSEEVRRAAMERGFVGVACPMGGGDERMGKGPRGWVVGVLEGIEEGRFEEKDFWVHPFQG